MQNFIQEILKQIKVMDLTGSHCHHQGYSNFSWRPLIIFVVMVVALMSSQATHVAASGIDFMVNSISLPRSTPQFKTK